MNDELREARVQLGLARIVNKDLQKKGSLEYRERLALFMFQQGKKHAGMPESEDKQVAIKLLDAWEDNQP
jgi:hypothetical protein